MALVKITAVIRRDALESVETRLKQVGVPGITVSTVKGFGEYANFFSHDWMVSHARIELFVAADEADAIITAIRETAATGEAGDGIIAVLPVNRLIKIRSGEQTSGVPAPLGRAPSPAPAAASTAPQPPAASFLAWLIVVLGIGAGAAVMFVTSRHQMHILAALLGVVFVLCGILGGLAFARQKKRG